MKYLTFTLGGRLEFRDESQMIVVYLKPDGMGGVIPSSGPNDDRTLIMEPQSGRPVMRAQYLKHVQSQNPNLPPTPPPAAVNWESVPSYNLGAGDVYFKDRYFRKEGYDIHAFSAGGNNTGRLILENCVVWSDGNTVASFQGKAKLINCILAVTPPTVYGQANPRNINLEYFHDLEMENCTLIGGSQIYLTGLNGQFAGDAAAGQGAKILRTKWHNISGVKAGVRSNWGRTHQDVSTRINIGGEIGWEVANFLQINSAPRINLRVQWNEVLAELGKGRTEDTISLYGGSGGMSNNRGIISDNLLEASGGWDWRYQPGVSTVYNASNQIPTGATSPQPSPDLMYLVRCSSTSLLVGDAYRSGYDDNTAYVTAARNIALGARPYISTQAGHHIRFEGNELYECDRHWSGVPYEGYWEGYYQISSSNIQASDERRIYGQLEFFDNLLTRQAENVSTTLELPASAMENGGSQGGNIKRPPVKDGGAAVIAAYRARRQAAGITVGSSLPIPPELVQWASKA